MSPWLQMCIAHCRFILAHPTARAQSQASQQTQGGNDARSTRDRAQGGARETRNVEPSAGPAPPNGGMRRPQRDDHGTHREGRHVEPRPGPSQSYHNNNQRYHHQNYNAHGYYGNGGYGGNVPNHYMNGVPEHAYPGHGHCFICGRFTGHNVMQGPVSN